MALRGGGEGLPCDAISGVPVETMRNNQDAAQRTCVVHVGMNKTGSTWLQQNLLPRVTSHKTVGRVPGGDRSILDVVEQMLVAERFERGLLRAKAEQIAGRHDRIFLSDEGLSSTLRFETDDLFRRNTERLAGEFPDARVLLVVRRQPDLILSSYAHYVRGGGTAAIDRFLSGEPVPGYRRPIRFRPGSFDLYGVASTFVTAFGNDHVVVVPYEWLRTDIAAFLARTVTGLCLEAEGLDELTTEAARQVHSSLSASARAVQRRVNQAAALVARSDVGSKRWYGRLRNGVGTVDRMLRPGRIDALERRVSRPTRAAARAAGECYGDSNKRLAEMTGLPLADLGYPC